MIRQFVQLAFVFVGIMVWVGCNVSADSSKAKTTFRTQRHPDTINTTGPYRVTIQYTEGSRPISGSVLYTAIREGKESTGKIELSKESPDESWTATIPGQPAGTTIFYHFSFSYSDGGQTKHPQRAPQARYLFQVLPLQLKSISVPLRPPAGLGVRIAITLETATPTASALHYRIGAGEFTAQLPMQMTAKSATVQEAAVTIPAQPTGTTVDLYFEVAPKDGASQKFPADAPDRFFSYKVGSPQTKALTGGGQVSALATIGDRLLVGLDGGGVVEAHAVQARPFRHTLVDGLPSNSVRALASDPAEGISYIGTRNGFVALRHEGGTFEPIVWPPFQQQDHPLWNQVASRHDGDLAIVSPLDGSVLLQLEGTEQQFEAEEKEAALLLMLANDELTQLQLASGDAKIVGLTAGIFDEVDGCFVLGAILRNANGTEQPALVRLCGREFEIFPITALPFSDDRAIPLLIEDLARDPESGELVASVRYAVRQPGTSAEASSVFIFRDGSLSRLSSNLESLAPAVTALLADKKAGRLIVGTYGQGLLIFHKGIVQHVGKTHGLPSEEITFLVFGENNQEIWLGTRAGLAQLQGNQAMAVYTEIFDTKSIQPDLVPFDQNAAGDLLVGSATGGFAVLRKPTNGEPQIIRTFTVGREIPDQGLCGEAIFDPQRRAIFAVHLKQGLLRFDDSIQLLTAEQGLKRTGIWHILRHPKSGLLWLVYPPFPFRGQSGAGIQFYDGISGGRFIPLEDQTLATIGDLLYVPERGTVFTAGAVGVLEFYDDGRFERRSVNLVSGIDRDPKTGEVVVVGTAIERWDGQRFQPVLFRADHPRLSPGKFYLRPAKDIAIDSRGKWHVLFPEGYLLTMDAKGNVSRVLDYEDGVPKTSRKLLYHAASNSLAVGTESEGMIFIENP